jgi:hypothetical protein
MIDGDLEGSFPEKQACHGHEVREDSPKEADHVRTSFANDLRRVLTSTM